MWFIDETETLEKAWQRDEDLLYLETEKGTTAPT